MREGGTGILTGQGPAGQGLAKKICIQIKAIMAS